MIFDATKVTYSTYSSAISGMSRGMMKMDGRGCHAPDPDPTRLANPNRFFLGCETIYWDSLFFFNYIFFF